MNKILLNVGELEVGKKYKDLKEMCEVLKLEYKDSTNSRKSLLKEIKSIYQLEKQGRGYLVLNKYEQRKITKNENDRRKNNGRNNTRKRKEFSNFLISRENENKIGVYKIVLDDNIYIGSTINGFRERFKGHRYKNKLMLHTYEMLDNGATFKVIEFCDGLPEIEIRDLENKYIKQYKEDDDWNLVNSRDAWDYIKKQKYKTIRIKIKEEEYDKVLKFLKDSNLVSE